MSKEIELTTTDDQIALVTIQRPERRNALSARTLGELHAVFDEIASSRELRVVVLTGAGRRVLLRRRHEVVERRSEERGRHADGRARRERGRADRPLVRDAGVHGGALREDPPPAPAGDRRGERRGPRRRLRAGPRLRHPHRHAIGLLRRRLHQARRLRLRHGDELPPAAAGRRLALGRAAADGPGLRRRRGRADRPRPRARRRGRASSSAPSRRRARSRRTAPSPSG